VLFPSLYDLTNSKTRRKREKRRRQERKRRRKIKPLAAPFYFLFPFL
jgi:hypothetical protein